MNPHGFKKIEVFNSVFTIYFFSFLNFILSVLLQLFLASLFGARVEMDTYVVAMVIPMIILNLVLSFEMVFVPTFKAYSLKKGVDKEKISNLLSSIFNLFCLILITISVFGLLLAPKLVDIIAPGFSAQAKELTQVLFRIMIPSVIFSSLTAFLISVYHFREKFVLPASVSVANILVMIVVTLLFSSAIGIRSLAWGVLLGSMVQFCILFPGFLPKKKYSLSIDFKHIELPNIAKKLLYLGVGGTFLGLILMIEKFLASRLPEGSISSLAYANKITSLIVLLPSVAIPIVLLPKLSRYHILQDLTTLRSLLSRGISMSILCIFPVAVLVLLFREPIIKLLLYRGVFDADAVSNTSVALLCYFGVLFTTGMSKVTSVGFFAAHDLRTPFLLMLGAFLFYLCIAPLLANLFFLKGLALSLSLVFILSIIAEVFILRKRFSGIGGSRILNSFLKIVFSSFIMGVVSRSFFKNLPLFFIIGEKFTLALRLGSSVLIGLLAFNIFCFLLRVEELRMVYELSYLKLRMFIRKFNLPFGVI